MAANYLFREVISGPCLVSSEAVPLQVQQKLGDGIHPQFCQLLVTDEPYGKHLSLAPRVCPSIALLENYFTPPTLTGNFKLLLDVTEAPIMML